MDKEKQIEEMAADIYSLLRSDTMSRAMASLLYEKGWKKQSEGECPCCGVKMNMEEQKYE